MQDDDGSEVGLTRVEIAVGLGEGGGLFRRNYRHRWFSCQDTTWHRHQKKELRTVLMKEVLPIVMSLVIENELQKELS
jgi:hypothetical protein